MRASKPDIETAVKSVDRKSNDLTVSFHETAQPNGRLFIRVPAALETVTVNDEKLKPQQLGDTSYVICEN